MGIFDPIDEEELNYTSQVSEPERLIRAHIDTHPGFDGPEVAKSGNRYTLPDADGRPVTWNGATTLAEELETRWGLEGWKLRQAVYGVSVRPDLALMAAATTPDDKETLTKVVKDALAAAATDAGANEGTAWHMVFERVARGEPLEALPEYFHKGIRAWQECLQRHGIEILPQYLERAVRCLLFKVSGRVDAIMLWRGRYVIVDYKSGKDPQRYPKSPTVQLGMYANSGELFDPTTNTIEPMPDVRKDVAIMIHFDKVNHTCEAYAVPIDIGWWGARLARELREWRKMDCMITPLESFGSLDQFTETKVVSTNQEISAAVKGFNVGEKERVLGPYAGDVDEIVWNVTIPPGHTVTKTVEISEETITASAQIASKLSSVLAGAQPDDDWTAEEELPVDGFDDSSLEVSAVEEDELTLCSFCLEPQCPTCNECVGGQCPKAACGCEIVSDLGEPEVWAPSPLLEDGTPAVDEEAEAIELSAKSKPELQAMCLSVGVSDVAHHRKWLATSYVKARNSRGWTETTAQEKRAEAALTGAPSSNGTKPEELTEVEALRLIGLAREKSDLQALHKRWTEGSNPRSWNGELAKVGLAKFHEIKSRVASESPFA